jgi:short-subunit dehydrogenase
MGRRETVVLTGASAGVGRATAQRLAGRGARVALLARRREGLEATAREVEKLGGEALVVPVDAADAGQVAAAAERVEQAWGPIDIWINCAMTTMLAPFADMTVDEFRRITEVTYLGYVYGTHEALKRMLPRDRGTIVQVGSSLAYRGIPLQSAYCGAKHAIRGFTDSLRTELLHNKSKVRLCMVQLPAVNTPQFTWSKNTMPRKHQPVPPIYQPDVCADAIVWAAHHRRRELWVGLSTHLTIWLSLHFPALADIYLGRTGYDSQQYDGMEETGTSHNLWKPVEGDFGKYGPFSERARTRSLLLQLEKTISLPRAAALLASVLLVRALAGGPSRSNPSRTPFLPPLHKR